ncbi:hypothetical protein OC861_000756 [Tilletia horrida]|nr:hypothetical protein OC861_000756 [Tilletia horrida]
MPRPLCLLYRNRPCVVIGRNQNPWKELNIREMAKRGIPMVRRRSGGGSVFHDLGNTNYSIHVDKDVFTRRINAELVSRALNNLLHSSPGSSLLPDKAPIASVYVNHRSDICVRMSPSSHTALPAPLDPTIKPDPPDPLERKISGSAYKLTAHRAYHHGTLLLHADLSQLGHSLRNLRGEALQSKGVASVRATVVNLVDAFPEAQGRLHWGEVSKAIVREFGQTYASSQNELGFFAEHALEAIKVGEQDEVVSRLRADSVFKESYQDLQSWEWIFGQTPEFTHALIAQPDPEPVLTTDTANKSKHDVDPAPTSAAFPFGTFGLIIRCRRGIIEEARLCGLSSASSDGSTERVAIDESSAPQFQDAATEEAVREMAIRLESQRYDDFAEEIPTYLDGRTEQAFPALQSPLTIQSRIDKAAQILNQAGTEQVKRERAGIAEIFVRWLRDAL